MAITLEDLLIKEKLISKNRLEEAIALQQRKNTGLMNVLLSVGYVSEKEVAQMFNRRLGLPWLSLSSGRLKPIPDENLEEAVPYDFALKNNVLPLFRSPSNLVVAVVNPLNMEVIYSLEKLVGCQIKPLVATRSDIKKAIAGFYKKQ